jgi:hypothetical protein
VSGDESYVAPKPIPFYMTPSFQITAAAIVAGVALLIIGAFAFSRLSGGKRKRASQAQALKPKLPTPSSDFLPPSGESTLAGGPQDDFPIGGGTTGAPGSTASPKAPGAAGDVEVDYWEAKSSKPRGASPVTAVVSETKPLAGGDDDLDLIPADKAFADDAPFGGSAAPRPKSPSAPTPAAAKSPAAARPPVAHPPPTRPPKPVEEDEGPIQLEGFVLQSPGIEESETDFGIKDVAPPRSAAVEDIHSDLGLLEPENEAVPFALDVPLAETQTLAGQSKAGEEEVEEEEEAGVSRSPLESIEPSAPEEVASIRLGDDFPLGEGAQAEASAPLSDEPAIEPVEEEIPDEPPFYPGQSPTSPGMESSQESPPNLREEIQLPSATGKTAKPPAAPPGSENVAESTMVDGQARHKALFQDQLARGIAAMEKGNWKEAVKFLQVAHAMDPTNDFARDKLREAHEGRANEPT